MLQPMKTWEPVRIRKLRYRMELSQATFGERLGVTGNYVHLMEKGVKIPSKTLSLLLDFIDKETKGGEKKRGKGNL